MKVLFNKLKKCSKPLLVTFIISFLIYTGTLIWLTINLVSLQGIETLIRICVLVFFYLYFLGYLIGCLICLITKRKKTLIVLTIITLLLSGVFGFVSYHIDKVYNRVDNINKKYVTYTSNLIALKDTDEKDIEKIGIISNKKDIEGYVLAQEIIKKEKIDKDDLVSYDDYYEMLTALYAKEIDALFITSNYSVIYSSEDLFANIAYDVKVISEFSKKMENQDNAATEISKAKKLTEPFTILLLGVDSEKDGLNPNQAFNGDTLMMITFNPNTLNATMFSIPRDTYVPIACRKGALNKINSSAASGTKCVIDTIEDLTDIDIDYYVKINFKGVVDLVNAVGGVDIDVPVKFCEQNSDRLFGDKTICLDKGQQHLDGEQALAFARHRKTLPRGDFQRVEHQQMVVQGIADKARTLRTIDDFYAVLDAVSKNIDTNMTTNQMLSFYNVLKKMMTDNAKKDTGSLITIDHTYLTGSDQMIYNTSTRMNMYTFQYSKASLKEIVSLMKVNLELEEPEMIKTFSFSINEEYEQHVAGNVANTKGDIEDLVPSFVGQHASYAQSWARAHNVTLTINYIKKGDSGYDESLPNGSIVSQSVNAKTPTSSVKSLTIDVIDHSTTEASSTNEKEDKDNDDDINKGDPGAPGYGQDDEDEKDDNEGGSTPDNPDPGEKPDPGPSSEDTSE